MTNSTSAAQTVGRAVLLLRLVASSQSRNLRLIDIAEMASLDKSTAHRLLQRLVQERMLVRDAGQRGYRLGPLLHELGLAALPESNLRDVSEPALRHLAQTTGDMAFLLIRSGFDTVCLNRIAGNFEIQTMTRNVGDRHPLGVGAGGLALLAGLGDGEVNIVVREIAAQLRRYHLTPESLLERVRQTRERNFALDEGTAALDITALGKAIRDRTGTPMAAVFVASISNRMIESRKRQVLKSLAECVATIESALSR
ncbi:IclR family transcriptional regulator [Bordetella sp. BOR01]|uniref:IclR family transcriptional regulator n=1 Tax=Bordetella sp. BOR01 TaxID=2854779 RepID=UPI001C466DF8|nr:IclR family transcriptional regulator C-terminal domain-containing protein [Bordetella sp. BOR01]MBV7483481.1 helix-turn-helix domain-containing protein [Bordetella sp. BOR01]